MTGRTSSVRGQASIEAVAVCGMLVGCVLATLALWHTQARHSDVVPRLIARAARAAEPVDPPPLMPALGGTGFAAGTIALGNGGTAAARTAAAEALRYLGVPYVWGGTDPSGLDCSGLVVYAYRQINTSIPRTTMEQIHYGQPISPAEVAVGDLILFYHADGQVGHVGIYIGGGRMVHAPRTGLTVGIQELAGYPLQVAGIRRVA